MSVPILEITHVVAVLAIVINVIAVVVISRRVEALQRYERDAELLHRQQTTLSRSAIRLTLSAIVLMTSMIEVPIVWAYALAVVVLGIVIMAMVDIWADGKAVRLAEERLAKEEEGQ